MQRGQARSEQNRRTLTVVFRQQPNHPRLDLENLYVRLLHERCALRSQLRRLDFAVLGMRLPRKKRTLLEPDDDLTHRLGRDEALFAKLVFDKPGSRAPEKGDLMVFYSPKKVCGETVPCQRFTAVAEIGGKSYRAMMSDRFKPF